MTRRLVGIVADTHGAVHPKLPERLPGVDLIVHAGDIGGEELAGIEVLEQLQKIAPVVAVRGNYDNDPELVEKLLPDPSALDIAGLPAVLTHRLIIVDFDSHAETIAAMVAQKAPGTRLFIFGHTHMPLVREAGGVLFINPGYAGPDPIEGEPTMALLEVDQNSPRATIVGLD